jgi:glutamate synthase domain-containing protein 3
MDRGAAPTASAEALAARELSFDLSTASVRELNGTLHQVREPARVLVRNPGGKHAIAAGLDAPLRVEIDGHVGYYCAGMNKLAQVRVAGNAGTGVAENMMSGTVTVEGSASQSAGASAHGGLLVIRGDASARCGISLKGAEILVCGSIGHMGAFMAQKGCLVVLGDAGGALGDSLYEARLYVHGKVAGLGADCVEKEMRAEHLEQLAGLLARGGVDGGALGEFRRYGSARRLYNFHLDNLGSY